MSDEQTAAADITPTGPKKLDPMDMMHMQNLQLRHENLQLRKNALQQEALKLQESEVALGKELVEMRSGVGVKYGVNIETVKIRQDGTLEE